jgi:hypothetical protein
MSHPGAPRDIRRSRRDRDRTLSRVAKTTVAAGASAVLAAGALAAWLSMPAHARAGSTTAGSTTAGSTSSSSTATSEQDDDGLQPTSPPTAASTGSGSQQPTVVSGGS